MALLQDTKLDHIRRGFQMEKIVEKLEEASTSPAAPSTTFT